MSKGVVLIARNNSEVDYIKQSVFSAKRIHRYLNLPVTILTDSPRYLKDNFDYSVFDNIVEIKNDNNYTYKKYFDGSWTRKSLEFKNTARSDVFDLTPYNETLLLDTDLIISNNSFNQCFDQLHDFLIYKKAFDLTGWRDTSEFENISDASPDFYWATAVFFRKTETNRIFFNLIKHIKEYWAHYRNLYQINSGVFRNDFAFSIAIHMMNGHQRGNFAKTMPDTMFYITDKDQVLSIKDESILLLAQKENDSNKYFPIKISNSNVHIMNKFSLNRVIDNDN